MERKESIEVKGIHYVCHIYLEKRNSIRASIGKQKVIFRLPSNIAKEEYAKEILRMKEWARKQLEKKPLVQKTKARRSYVDGDSIQISSQTYNLRIAESKRSSSHGNMRESTFYLFLVAGLTEEQRKEHCSILMSRVLAANKISYIQEKVKTLNEKHFSFHYNKIFLKYNESNWGSCSSKKNLNFSTRLFFAPEEVIDYVCIHELAHLQEANHSPAFWSLVEKAIPDYKEKRRWLREHSEECWF